MSWLWVLPAVAQDLLSYVCQGVRWRLLMRPFAQMGIVRTTQAIYAGLFVNEVLPARLGEMVRAYFVHRWTGAKGSAHFPTAFMVSCLIPLFQGSALWMLMIGSGLQLGLLAGIAVFLVVHLGTTGAGNARGSESFAIKAPQPGSGAHR